MTHGDTLPSWRGARLPTIWWGLCPAASLQRAQSEGTGAGRGESCASTTFAAGSRSIAVPGHVEGSAPDMMGGGHLPSGLFPPNP